MNTRFSIQTVALMLLMMLSAGLAARFSPTLTLADERPAIHLKTMVPMSFGDWRALPDSAQIINPQANTLLNQLYSETLSRTYINSQGYQVMLSIAYGKNQGEALQLHKPEICYPAQGFTVVSNERGSISLDNNVVAATRLSTTMNLRKEPVTYWTVVGDHVTRNDIDKKLTEMRYAVNNRIPDGMLVRVSSIDADVAKAFSYQNQFASEMIAAIEPANRERFSGVAKTTVAGSSSQ